MSDAADKLLSGEAWRAFCAELAEVGDAIVAEGFPTDPRERAEGFRYLSRLLAYAMRMEIECGDPLHPQLCRYEEPHTQWGGPNPDNLYLRAAVDPRHRYRVWGELRGVRQLIASLQEGDMQLEQYGVFSEQTLDDWQLGPGGQLELILSAQAPDAGSAGAVPSVPTNWMPMHEKARLFQVRFYVADWARDAHPALHIERIGAEGEPPPPLEPAALAAALERASHWVHRSALYWNRYTSAAAERATPNRAAPPRATPGGADNIRYGSCVWELAPDEALLLTCEVPEAQYWSFCIHTLAWLESGDFANRQTSLSGPQLHVDTDGRVRVALSARDPGVPNWIDSEGRRRGLLVYRWVWATTSPEPLARLVKWNEVRSLLPDDHPTIDTEERRRRLRARREQLWKRYL